MLDSYALYAMHVQLNLYSILEPECGSELDHPMAAVSRIGFE